MAHRRLGADEGTVLFACSICGIPARYPTEMVYRSDRLFQCFRHADSTTNLDEARKQGQSVRFGGDESAPRCPLGVPPKYDG